MPPGLVPGNSTPYLVPLSVSLRPCDKDMQQFVVLNGAITGSPAFAL